MSIVSETNDGVKCVEFSEVIKIDEGKVRQHVEEVVRQSVEETLNGLLEAELERGREVQRHLYVPYEARDRFLMKLLGWRERPTHYVELLEIRAR